MKRYDERMLHLLLDRYERSLLSDGRNQRTIHITERITKTNFPEYFDESSLEYEELHRQLHDLETQGLVELEWAGKKAGHILRACRLNTERIQDCYRCLHRTPKEDKWSRIQALLLDARTALPVFTNWAIQRIGEGKSVRQYMDPDQPELLDRVLTLAAAILQNQKDIYLRAFSIQVFHDSKIAEKELGLALSILKHIECPERLAQLENDEILEEYNIYKNPAILFLKGCGILKGALPQGIGVFQDDLPRFMNDLASPKAQKEQPSPDVILTIENLTSFHQWKPEQKALGEQELVIYLAGYANHAKRTFLKALHARFPAARFYHFGDIDCGGFRIWKNLCEETGIPITPYQMDLATFHRYLDLGRALTEGDRRTLRQMLEEPFFKAQWSLLQEMLKTGRKLEQECITCIDAPA